MYEIVLHLNHYTLRKNEPHNSWWLMHVSGEGMEINNKELENILDEYFKENY